MHCSTCRIPILDISHYSSDLHNHNIKLKLHELPTLSATEFHQLQSPKFEPEEQIFTCDFCGKFFKRLKSMENHIHSHFAAPQSNHNNEVAHNNINTNILTDGVNLFLENSKVLAPKRSFRNTLQEKSAGGDRLMTREYSIPFERPKCIGTFPVVEKVSNRLDKAKYIVRRFD